MYCLTIRRLLGIASEATGNFKAALHHYSKTLALAEAKRLTAWLPVDLNNLASVQLATADYCLALKQFDRARSLLITLPVSTTQVKVIGNTGYAWLKLGQLKQAEKHLQQALAFAQQSGARAEEQWLAALCASLYHAMGESECALRLARQHCQATPPYIQQFWA